jgi:hypothetical protein
LQTGPSAYPLAGTVEEPRATSPRERSEKIRGSGGAAALQIRVSGGATGYKPAPVSGGE